MSSDTVLIRFLEDEGCWRLFWTSTMEPADDRAFPSIAAAAPVARELMGYDGKRRKPDLKLVE